MESKQNAHCYSFNTFDENSNELLAFDAFVDATYVITMESSTRKEDYIKRLISTRPTKIVWIMTNKGFKSCNKMLKDQTTRGDLIDANLQVFRHANEQGYRNILVLEDDFWFDEDNIRIPEYINDVSQCMKQHETQPMYYNLGPIPVLFYPNFNLLMDRNIRAIYITMSHANIYNRNIRDKVLSDTVSGNVHWDVHITKNYLSYFNIHPLCYQTFPPTENQKVWASNIFDTFIVYVFIAFIRMFRMDVSPFPGYSVMYAILFIVNYTIWIMLFVVISAVIWYIGRNLLRPHLIRTISYRKK